MTVITHTNNPQEGVFGRRQLWLALALAVLPQAACSQGSGGTAASTNSAQSAGPAPLSPADAELKHRFRGIRGGERRIDGLVKMNRVALHSEKGYLIETGTFSPTRRSEKIDYAIANGPPARPLKSRATG